MKGSRFLIGFILLLITLYLVIPMIAVMLFSISNLWKPGEPFPSSYTTKWYLYTINDPAVQMAIIRSFIVGLITVVTTLLLVTPTAYVIRLIFPQFESFMRLSTLLPFVMPGVILALGLIQIYSHPPIRISGTVILLVFSYVSISLPLMYYSIANALDAIDGKVLTEAAQSLGATLPETFFLVIFPNIIPGIISGSLLTFASILGEFTLVNLLVGTRFKTLQMYLYIAINKEGHLTSALTVIYFIVVTVASVVVLTIGNRVLQEQVAPLH